MSARTPLVEGCNGGVFCKVPGHVYKVPLRKPGEWRITHIPLTRGQEATLRERRDAEAAARG